MKEKILYSKVYLYILVIITGFSLLSLELLYIPLVEPFFGRYQIQWAFIITIVMISIATGYILGGKLADKYKSPKSILNIMFLSGIYTLLIPWVSKSISLKILSHNFENIIEYYYLLGSIVIGLTIFLPIMIAISMIEPCVIKLSNKHNQSIGKSTGNVFFFSTIAGLVGLYVTNFILIPYLGIYLSICIIGCLITFSTAIGIFNEKSSYIITGGICIAFLYFSHMKPIHGDYNIHRALYNKPKTTVVTEKQSKYQYIQIIKEEDNTFKLLTSDGFLYYQTIFNPKSIFTNSYYDAYLPITFSEKDTPEVLILGLAGGAISRGILGTNTTALIDGVELDNKVIETAKKHFDLEDPRLTIFNQDARTYLNLTNKKYDLIIIDTYVNSLQFPWHLTTLDFFKLVNSKLNENGIVALNTISNMKQIKKIKENTIAKVFNFTYNFNRNSKNDFYNTKN